MIANLIKVYLTPSVKLRLRFHLALAGHKEIGGMLFGEQIQANHFKVVDFSIDNRSGTFANFVRDPIIHKKSIDRFFHKTGHNYTRFNYLGEWHSHPSFSVLPSREDAISMQNLVNSEDSIEFAFLLIVKLESYFRLDYSNSLFQRNENSH